jgi:hypothetical protein
MTTPDGWQVELVRFGPEPAFRVRCGNAPGPQAGVVVTLAELVSVLGDSFELLQPAAGAEDADAEEDVEERVPVDA